MNGPKPIRLPDEPVYRLPPYSIEEVLTTLAQTVDYGHALIGVPDAWKRTKGRGIRVAILDTGIDQAHQDLKGQVVAAQDFSGSSLGVADRQGHGTHVAGIIAGIDNQVGIVGVCPDIALDGGGLLIGKVLGDDGSGSDSWIAAGVRWAVSQKANIISMSLGSPQPGPQMQRAIQDAADAGVFVICAAGNDGTPNSVNYPAKWPFTIAVSAVDADGKLAPYSSRGPEVDVAAPGSNVLSCGPGNQYLRMSGTSMATPYVTAVVALLLSKHKLVGGVSPVKTVEDLRGHIKRTAADRGPTGQDPEYGFGLIDAGKLVADLPPPVTPPPLPPSPGLPGPVLEIPFGPVRIHIPAVAGDWASVALDFDTQAALLASLETSRAAPSAA